MTREMMQEVCAILKKHGCRSLHIGGGEPFMDFDGLCSLVHTARTHGIVVEYVETNAYWADDEEKAVRYLRALSRAGANALCISHDAYHAEFIDPTLPVRLADICRRTGFGYFLWETQINRLRFNGRAITLEEGYIQKKPPEDIQCEASKRGACKSLTSRNHFHVDLHGKYIPPGCTGIVLPLEEVFLGISSGKYPAFEALHNGGLPALLALALGRGFALDPEGYPSVCNCCFHVRKWLSGLEGFAELDKEHYIHAKQTF
jgi:hypothetical protein